jgi:hypothetical protein
MLLTLNFLIAESIVAVRENEFDLGTPGCLMWFMIPELILVSVSCRLMNLGSELCPIEWAGVVVVKQQRV